MTEATAVILPSMGEGITEATIVRWLKSPGDKVEKDDPLLEVSTDKVDTEIPSPASGFLVKTWVSDGETVEVNECIAHIGDSMEATCAKPSKAVASTNSSAASSQTSEASRSPNKPTASVNPMMAQPRQMVNNGDVRSSPLVRKIAKEHNIDLRFVSGSGLGGRITKTDIMDFINQPPVVGYIEKPEAHLEWGTVTTHKEGSEELLDGVPVRREKMTKIRALTAEHMARSVRASAHATMNFEVDLQKVVTHRSENKDAFEKNNGFKLTFTPYFLYAAVQTIKKHPIVNVSVDGEDILWKDDINLGCAVALESGLIVPVLKQTQEDNFLQIANKLNDVVTRARSKQLQPDDVKGGTFSITNPGMFGSITAAPIINQPQVAILCINAIVKRPVVINDEVLIRPMIQVGLTFDHRVIDGQGAAEFLASYKALLEAFEG